MPYLSSNLCSQMFLCDPTYFSGEDKVLYPEDVSDELFYGSDSSNIRKEGFDLEGDTFDYHFLGDDLSYNQNDQAISKNDYFNCFWGENWFFSLNGSNNRSHVGVEKLETPHPDEEQAIWSGYNYSHKNVEMPNNLNREFLHEDVLKNTFNWSNCYECFDNVHSGNDESYGYIADEGLSEWLSGFSPCVGVKERERFAMLEADELGPGYDEATVATKLASQER